MPRVAFVFLRESRRNPGIYERDSLLVRHTYMFFFSHTSTSQLLYKSCGHRLRPFSPPVLALAWICYRAQGSAIPLLVDFSSGVVANSRSRAFRKSVCAQEKVPTNLYEYALGGIRTHEPEPYQARGLPDILPGRSHTTA